MTGAIKPGAIKPGDGADRTRIEQMTAELGLGERVTFAGKVADADLPRYYAACDVFAHPNRVEGPDLEGFGLVFLEAAASGRPSIGGNSGGVPEAVQDGTTGVLVSGTNVNELVKAIERFMASPMDVQLMGSAARDRAIRDFDWARTARAVEAIHQRVWLEHWGRR